MWLVFARERSSSTRQWWPEPVVCSVVCGREYVGGHCIELNEMSLNVKSNALNSSSRNS